MTERDVYELLAACLRAQAREQDKVNPAYARELRARAARHARTALSLNPPARATILPATCPQPGASGRAFFYNGDA